MQSLNFGVLPVSTHSGEKWDVRYRQLFSNIGIIDPAGIILLSSPGASLIVTSSLLAGGGDTRQMKFILGLWIEMVAGMGLGTTGVPVAVAGNYRERERERGLG